MTQATWNRVSNRADRPRQRPETITLEEAVTARGRHVRRTTPTTKLRDRERQVSADRQGPDEPRRTQ